MPEAALAKARWSPAKFARARAEGHTLAECAKIAGSKADEANLARIGYRWLRSANVQRRLSDVTADLERGWRGWAAHAADVCDGLVPNATEMDILGNGTAIGRALGKFIQRIEVNHTERVEVIGFLAQVPAPTLATASTAALEEELARRKALPAVTVPALPAGSDAP